jgi:uncharacterized protein (DUF983 family)
MNTRCPQCNSELRGRYLGAFELRCPSCKAALKVNLHDSETKSTIDEPLVYIGGVVLLFLFMVVSDNVELSLFMLVVSCILYLAARIHHWSKPIPNDWPRWLKVSRPSNR